MKQRTIKAPITLGGIGLHTGLDIELKLLPASENTGYCISRVDLPEKPTFSAWAEYVETTPRNTTIKRKEVEVKTIEHAMSALYALGIDNCLLEVNAPEFPILDGSAQPYVDAILEVGIQEQKEDREYFYVKKKIEVSNPETGASIIMLPADEFALDVHVAYPSPVLGNQFASLHHIDQYAQEIAMARTFVFVREILPLYQQGLIRGGDLKNALVIHDKELSEEEKASLMSLTGASNESISHLGYINPKEGIANEPARHKLLDLIGDLALTGTFIKGHIIATCPGHGINNLMAREIRKEIKGMEKQAPVYNPDAQPLLDINDIRKLLPHRYPFLLIDKIVEIGDKHIVGVKNVTGNEPFFEGHFPEEPVIPGVLIVEAMAQTGGTLVLHQMGNPEDASTYFMKIDGVKFRQKVVPGDTLLFKLRLLTEIRRGVATMRGLAFVGNTLVCEAEFMAQIVVNKQ